MLRARQVQNGVVDGNQKVVGLTLELASERTLIEVLDDILANEPPELAWRNPHVAFKANYLGGMSTGHTNTSKTALTGISNWSGVQNDGAQYTGKFEDYKIIL
jgi:hypothetical protein